MSDGVKLMEERDIEVAMRDGTKPAVDVYRPEAAGEHPGSGSGLSAIQPITTGVAG
jgi:predicted acyl esterase